MRNLAPDIVRQRLLIEGHYAIEVTEQTVSRLLLELAAHLDLRTYGQPIIYSPAGQGREINQGYDAFIPLVDSGISLYIWSQAGFFSVVVFSCKPFPVDSAIAFTRGFFETGDDIVAEEF
jgi:S-adenosylmethionine decarboxylase